MDLVILALLLSTGLTVARLQEQKKRIALLSHHLGPYQIEKLMENLTQGYLRALGEEEPARREQIWSMLVTAEQELANQFQRFTTEFGRLDEPRTRVSRLALGLPWAERLLPRLTFDARKAFAIHARGIAAVAANSAGHSPRDKAFIMTAELMLMQHTCHWFCRSRRVASARLLLRHQTSYEQVVNAVSPDTRRAYMELLGAARGGSL
ncbi:hypothetical protein [Hydrogenophaga sp.]|uniref:hypothetical protein n=1 Tax=Hydrogenophaga sp. TaxID=1904254 RepID=UPI002617E378|nr:hypothetical protein [Hydrogenophaga sp.]MCW5653888.1 hypothetical protein [Hydrogenophaga sp.]